MTELHESARQEAMIAEVNTLYAPKLIIMDATEVFTSEAGNGEIAAPGIVCAAATGSRWMRWASLFCGWEGSKGRSVAPGLRQDSSNAQPNSSSARLVQEQSVSSRRMRAPHACIANSKRSWNCPKKSEL